MGFTKQNFVCYMNFFSRHSDVNSSFGVCIQLLWNIQTQKSQFRFNFLKKEPWESKLLQEEAQVIFSWKIYENSTTVHAFFQGNLPCNVIVFNKALYVFFIFFARHGCWVIFLVVDVLYCKLHACWQISKLIGTFSNFTVSNHQTCSEEQKRQSN